MAKGKKKKVRTQFRKRYSSRTRVGDVTKNYREQGGDENLVSGERVSGKGDLSRKRVIRGQVTENADDTGQQFVLDIDEKDCSWGRVLRVHGLNSFVQLDDGTDVRCATRGLLKTIGTDLRHVVVAGDRVAVKMADRDHGVIQRVDPRHGCISRTSRGRQHLIASNVEQLIVVTSCGEPEIKPHLVDRFLLTAEKSGVQPIIIVNKVDLTEDPQLQSEFAVWGQLGYPVVQISATQGWGIELLRHWVRGKRSVIAGQSGVGKSSILNAIQSGLALRVGRVSDENQKGRHTTTTGQLIPLKEGGFIVDTPGIRQFQLWDILPKEAEGLFRDVRQWSDQCRFPDCSHTHEHNCAVKGAVADGQINLRRYDSFCQIQNGDE